MNRDEGSHEEQPDPGGRKAFALILAKLGRRDHTEKELSKALTAKGFPPPAIEAALERARAQGLVDDVRLAATLARSIARTGRQGPRRAIATLRRKGIVPDTARAAARQAFGDSGESEASLLRFTTRLLRRARGETLKERRIKALRSLVGRGFELSEARRVLRIAENALMTENGPDDADS